MRMLVKRTPIGSALPFDLDGVKEHMRVDTNDENDAITTIGQTAAAELEQLAQIALLNQTVRVIIFHPVLEGGLSLPVGPVADDDTPTVTFDGDPFYAFDFVGGLRPYLRWIPAGYFVEGTSRMTIEYQAGFGSTAADIPSDLSQAIMDQAALHYDGRSPMNSKMLTTSPHMARIAARYRGVQA